MLSYFRRARWAAPRTVFVVLLGVAAVAGCVSAASAQESVASSPTPSLLSIQPPRIVAEAGVLPTSPFFFLDRFDEWAERTIFSFGIPALRARILLVQAAERIAELQALERVGRLTPEATRALLERHTRLLSAASELIGRQLALKRASPDLLALFVRTRLAAADVIEERAAEQQGAEELLETLPAYVEDADAAEDEPEELKAEELLSETADALVEEVENDLGLAAEEVPVSVGLLRLIAEQKLAKAERDLVRAQQAVEDRRVRGRVVVAEAEIRFSAASAIVTAREFLAAGNAREALSAAALARDVTRLLASGKIVVNPQAADAPARLDWVLSDLVREGVISLTQRDAVAAWAHQAVTAARTQESAR